MAYPRKSLSASRSGEARRSADRAQKKPGPPTESGDAATVKVGLPETSIADIAEEILLASRTAHLAGFWNLRHERANGFETCFLLVHDAAGDDSGFCGRTHGRSAMV